jgi:hypothetical protein
MWEKIERTDAMKRQSNILITWTKPEWVEDLS